MMSLDALEGCAKKPYKISFFEHPLARCRRNRKRKEKKGKKKVTPNFGGASKTGRKWFHHFCPKSFSFFSKSSKTKIFIAFPEKLGGNHFFEKGYVTKRTDLEGKKSDNFLVPFRQKCLRRCQSKKRGGWGGEAPPPKKEERSTVMAEFLLFLLFFVVVFFFWLLLLYLCVFCCCFLLLLVFCFVLLLSLLLLFLLLLLLLSLCLLLFFLLFLLLLFPQNTQRKKNKLQKHLFFFQCFCLLLFFSLSIYLSLAFSLSLSLSLFPFFPFSSLSFPSLSFFLSFLAFLFLFLILLFFLPLFLLFFLLFFLLLFFFHFVCAIVFVALTLVLVFVLLKLIFGFVNCFCFLVLVVVFLCCYVVKLGIAKKRNKKNTPPKKWKYFRAFLQDKLWLHVPKLLFFLAVLLFFSLLLKNTIKIGFFDDFEMLIFSSFGKNCRVNNLATVGSITWPHFLQTFWKCGQVIDPTVFTCLFVKTCFFFKNLILPSERRRFLKNKTKQQKTIKKVAKLLTYGGQVIDPTACICVYVCWIVYVCYLVLQS